MNWLANGIINKKQDYALSTHAPFFSVVVVVVVVVVLRWICSFFFF